MCDRVVIDVTDDAISFRRSRVFDAVDADIDYDCVASDMIGAEKMGPPDCGDHDVCGAGDGCEITRARMGDGHGGIAGLAAPHEQQGHGFSDDHAAADDDGICAGGFDAAFLQKSHATEGRAGDEAGWVVHCELGDVDGMKAIDVLVGSMVATTACSLICGGSGD